MTYKIIDNFLTDEEFETIRENVIVSGGFPWYTGIGVAKDNANDGCYFTHVFYNNFGVTSNHFVLLEPILNRINPIALIRIKANFYPTTPKIVYHGYHVDILDYEDNPVSCKGCLFYLNSNDGKTIFENGDEIESVANRALIFDSSMMHQSTTCTDDVMGRFNINFNYF